MPYIGKQPLTGAYQLCDAIVTSATATYNLLVGGSAVIPGSANNCIVSLNGVVQAPVGAFTVSGSTITFASTLSATDVIDFILILGNVFDIGTPTNGAVTNSSLNSNVITGQTAETTVAGGDLVLLYDDSASALRKMTRTNFVSGLGGLTNAQGFYASSGQAISSGSHTAITVTFGQLDGNTTKAGVLGSTSNVTVASGVFSFATTGIYYINWTGNYYFASGDTTRAVLSSIQVSSDGGSNYSRVAQSVCQLGASVGGSNNNVGSQTNYILDVDNTTNVKFRLQAFTVAGTCNVETQDYGFAVNIIKLGDT